jgi:hypothetical protein
MKRIVLFALTLALLLCAAAPAFAAGKLEVVQEKFYSIEPYEDNFYAYIFAELTNSGDKPIEFANGLWEIYNADGDALDSEDWLYSYPDVLEPGQVGYLFSYKSLDDVTAETDAADYMLTISGKAAKENPNIALPATVEYVYTDGDYRDKHELVATITNDTDTTAYNFRVLFVVKDAEGKLIFVDDIMPSYVGILPGASVEVKCDVSYENVVEALLEKGEMAFDKVEVVAYIDTDY